ncbi:uncharacterized protein LOC129590351 [Paramacrobiotus metropolitanus]|uniref:uncharacterized protein LOC129590351 n=1 Tax=Paramacrobiotus metropolitanus TaxID=2943436 RepID=UPI0024459CC3|nr:uncharacterized protein LOC129590351 [Paramacrobiotus metropolitanus]
MESRLGLIALRSPLVRSITLASRPNAASVLGRRTVSYDTSVNPQSSLDKSFESDGGRFDPEAGPPGPVHPKIKQMQKFYQTNTGKPLWRKTPLAEFLYRLTWLGVIGGTCFSLYFSWTLINPKKKKT